MNRAVLFLSTTLIALPASSFAGHDDWRISASQHRWATYYAETAVRQARQSLRLACGYYGPRWSTNYRQHYDWALRKRTRSGEVEIDRRHRSLRECQSRRGHYGYRHHRDDYWQGRGHSGPQHRGSHHRGRPDFNRGRDRGRRGHGHGHG